MRRRAHRGAATLAACALLWGCPTWAHHSVTAMYDLNKIVTLAGTVQTLQLGSPHSRLVIEVPEPYGRYSIWQVELPSLTFLQRAGWTEQTLKRGERITLTGSPARYNASQLYVRSVTRADGLKLALVPGAAPP